MKLANSPFNKKQLDMIVTCDEFGQKENSSLVAHNETTVARLVHAAPSSLGQIGRGEEEVGHLILVRAQPRVGLDVRHCSRP